ncbi:MAG: aminoacyl--tRNA ligase-related protein [Chitinophagaceae bacterium]
MLQVNVLRQNIESVKEKLLVKHFKQVELVDEVIALDDERKKWQLEFDTVQAKINASSKEIGNLMKQGNKQEADTLKLEVSNWKQEVEQYNQRLNEVEKTLQEKLVLLPNLPAEIVPIGKTPEENLNVKEVGTKPNLYEGAKPHWDLIDQLNLVDFELGSKITGRGFPVYKGKGAKLQRALVQYFLDYNTAAGYLEYLPPFMVNETSAYSTGQLPDKEGQMYHVQTDNFYLIPTAEVPVTNIYRDVLLKADELPIKMTAYSPCFRREAGSFGKDVRGLNQSTSI